MNKKWNIDYVTWAIIALFGIVFFFFLGEKGIVLCKDSKQYLNYADFNGVMPLYPLFISLHRVIFGEQLYLGAIFLSQGLIALLTSMGLTSFISKEFSLKSNSKIIIFLMSLLPYAYTLPEHVSTHEVMTESLAFPLFYVFVIVFFYGIFYSKYIYFLFDLIPLFALVMLRSHLLFLVAFYGVLVIAVMFKKRHYFWEHKAIIFGLLIGLLIIIILFFVYRQRVSDKGDENSPQIVNALFGRALYIMKESDEELFQDEEMKVICNRLYIGIGKEKQRLEYAKDGLLKWEDISIGFNEDMKLGNKIIYQYFKDTRPETDYDQRIALVEKVKVKLVPVILKNNIGRYLEAFFYMLPSGFLSMVFIQKRSIYLLCSIYGFAFYLSYLTLMVVSFKTKQNKIGVSSLLILMLSILNVTITNMIHYGLQRYFVYTFGLMYIMMFVMMIQLCCFLKKRHS